MCAASVVLLGVTAALTCKIVSSIAEPIHTLGSLSQLLKETSSKTSMLRDLGTNQDYIKIQKENVISHITP